MRVAGIGARSAASSQAVLAALDEALAFHGLARADIDALAVVPAKAGEAGIADAARTLGVPLSVADPASLEGVSGPTTSSASLAATGTPSASETAALAVAGPGARLLGPRLIRGPVTCAIAQSAA